MVKRQLVSIVLLWLALIFITGCEEGTQGPVPGSPTASTTPAALSTPTATNTATSTPSPTATATATPTPTPTPTAPPIIVLDEAETDVPLATPEPQPGAPCGVVDTLDFPLDPPDAREVALGGQDFGVYRERYSGIHAGEDWLLYSGRTANFGVPVYSIGHGQVMYAAPNGWGADKGVLIVRHVFTTGDSILSFYGHLDPPSVVLRAGECVTRGQQIAQIGKPRTPPHLHFEIRSHMPGQPGPGYWSSDPTLAGWEPPSQFIWDYRITTTPGVVWTHSTHADEWRGVGILNDDTFVVLEGAQLVGMDVMDGSLRWSQTLSNTSVTAAVGVDGATIYLIDRAGRLKALQVPDPGETGASRDPASPLELRWEIKLAGRGVYDLLPLPKGGVVAAVGRQILAVSAAGKVLWSHSTIGKPQYWVLAGDRMIVSVMGSRELLWILTESGAVAWQTQILGIPAIVGDQVWVYDAKGVYRLNPETAEAELLFALPRGFLNRGAILALPEGGVLVAHNDLDDKRLIVLNPDGSLRWERSYAESVSGIPYLMLLDDQVYFVAQNDRSISRFGSTATVSEITFFAVDTQSVTLRPMFTAGTRRAQVESTEIFAIGEDTAGGQAGGPYFLMNLGGVSLTLFEPSTLKTRG
ncbi:MAG: PQQ-binding-like beta-propeller repeat protein [Anaerolineae bacterium]|nr:PQQ-binding-like beta-propeller repeat protein [Anaerolineae bacterium]